MNRFPKSAPRSGASCGDSAGMRAFASSMHCRRTGKLILPLGCRRRLAKNLRAAGKTDLSGDEALHRLKAESAVIHALLRQTAQEGAAFLPAASGGVRILQLARWLLNGGENRLSAPQLVDPLCAFDRVQPLTMQEIQRFPMALRIALCEALSVLSADILHAAGEKQRAEKWVRSGGRGLPFAGKSAFFLEHALQFSSELEQPEMHALALKRADRAALRLDSLAESVHGAAADHCLRLENLLHLRRILEKLDWEPCFAQISVADMELNADPGQIYGRMDASSRAWVREKTAELARCFRLQERTVVRCALHAAQDSLYENSMHDPRSTVCWYLAEDAGRNALRRELGYPKSLPRCVPDADGRKTVLLVGSSFALVLGLILCALGNPLLWLYAPPLAWCCAMQLIARFYPRCVKPMRLLKLKIDSVPDHARTLVVLPVLLSSVARAEEMLAHMEALGCLEQDPNIDFLLLGDFQDAQDPVLPEDEAIRLAALHGVEALNQRADREKYYYLNRSRHFRRIDQRWMGENRKRGALMALNALLLNRPDASAAFDAEGGCARDLAGRYHYVVTLDADTEYLPGTIQSLVGTMLHPLNQARSIHGRRRGYAVLQPNMQLLAENQNGYVDLTSGSGGIHSYPVSVSDLYQDATAHGCFAGKGIYDVCAFSAATENCLRDDAILSHDLIEGILAGAGLVNDLSFYDTAPRDIQGDLKRLHRWTRGDWQLLGVLFSRLPIRLVDRMKLAGNLLRSLYAPALLGLFIHSVWLDAPSAFCLGLLLAFFDPILCGGRKAWRCALFQLSVLPRRAACQLDAILRTLWRLAVSRRHLMDWLPAADASDGRDPWIISGRIAMLLLLVGLLRPFWIPAVLALGLLFAVGNGWADALARQVIDAPNSMSESQRAFLQDLAERTWRFFETCVPEDGCGLPPDNLQLDPPVGMAMRTSPTNVGLYMISCFSARELGFIPEETLLRRWRQTVSTLEKLEKWQGHLYNWYDLDSLAPLQPRYVSSVDSGNLAGALLLCAHLAQPLDPHLARRIRDLAENMVLAALYDEPQGLFRIGMDVENGRLSHSHYDLYASESRILSFAALMLHQVPVKHWQSLSRASTCFNHTPILLSWSGTMFEYLMPSLLLPIFKNTLLGQSAQGMVACQIQAGRQADRPWGVSESGYYAFDSHLNYQYRAFGLKQLALSGTASQDVVAPYASALALPVAPDAAAENLQRMAELGWMGKLGMFEAADYTQSSPASSPRIVRSHMAHHQGMLLCAVCNALRGNLLPTRFMQIPQARALRLLLQEKSWQTPRLSRRQSTPLPAQTRPRSGENFARTARRDVLADVHLLHGGGVTALVNAHGGVHAWRGEWQLNRFTSDLRSPHEGIYVHVADLESGRRIVLGEAGAACMDAGFVRFSQDLDGLRLEMTLTVSPEDGALYHLLEAHNTTAEARDLEFTGCMAVAHGKRADMQAHPAFQNLFVESARSGENALLFRRRPREQGADLPELLFLLAGAPVVQLETRMEKLVGRSGSLGASGGIAETLTGSVGCILDPCAALRTRIHLEGGQHARFHFALTLVDSGAEAKALDHLSQSSAPHRALQLATGQLRSLLVNAGVSALLFRQMQRCSAFVLDPSLRMALHPQDQPSDPARRSDLWSSGISGDLPILLVEIPDPAALDRVRDALKIHAFYHLMGLETDLVFVDHHGGDYDQPVRNRLSDLIASSHLNGRLNVSGGAWIQNRKSLAPDTHRALVRMAALHFTAESDLLSQLNACFCALHVEKTPAYAPMQPDPVHFSEDLQFFNGYGGVKGDGYHVLLRGGQLPPAPWSNVLASDHAGAIVTERGGGFAWAENSRSDRLTAFQNDPLREGWGWMFYLLDPHQRRWIRLLPGDIPMSDFEVLHRPGESRWRSSAGNIAFEVRMSAVNEGVRFEIILKNEGKTLRHLELSGLVDWLMGVDASNRALLRTWSCFDGCFASGAASGVGCFLSDDPQARAGCSLLEWTAQGSVLNPQGIDHLPNSNGGWMLHLPLSLRSGEARVCRFLLGSAPSAAAAYALTRSFRSGGALVRSGEDWNARLEKIGIQTPDPALNFMMNGFLQAQCLNSRIRGRTGLYQPGGAFGFRDQLQDMLLMLHYEPDRVRKHILHCAARQFEQGDVLHWWHEPYTGVRTRISDDLLFLPYVTAQYVRVTGDMSILQDQVPFLQDAPIPAGRHELYAAMQPTPHCASLHEHCMRAFRRAADLGRHGLCRMGTGDWNDGMDRVGAKGVGESIWLSEFLAVCAGEYASISSDGQAASWLLNLRERLLAAIEKYGWDGKWYLRAYGDDGQVLGGRESPCCRIDLISQAWAVMAGLDPARCETALKSAWDQLADEDHGLIRLLAPPFDGQGMDPGYIAAYPAGVRENGGQYTHAACWMLCALADIGDAQRAHRALQMLVPLNHACDSDQADRYRVEPYVMAADIYTETENVGRGGWTWYTGSASWMFLSVLRLLGYEKEGDRVRLNSLLGAWPEVSVTLRWGLSRYRLICRQGVQCVQLDGEAVDSAFISMKDDARDHVALFPPRQTANISDQTSSKTRK